MAGAKFKVLTGQAVVSILSPSGQVLSQQVLSPGTHFLQMPANAPEEVLLKITPNGGDATYVLQGFEAERNEPFDINLEFESPLTASQQQIMQAAARSVASLIGKGLPSAVVDGKIIDDINIKVSTANLDGASGTQAQTKIDFMRYGTLLPAQSITQFDAADVAELERSGELFSVAQHEFLHALGFGNLWEAKGLVDYAGTPLAQYNGKQAVDAFKELGGLTDAISLETEGKGSAGLHWNEALFQDEVMTYDLGFKQGSDGQVFSPISAVTIASLADLGYQVNLNRATPDFGLFGGGRFNPDELTPEQIEAFRQLAEESVANQSGEFIPAMMPEVDPNKVAPEIWAHAEKFWKNGEYYDWVPYRIQSGDTLSELAQWKLGHGTYDYYKWIGDHNGIKNYDYIVTGDWIELPQWHPNYEQQQEQERLQREAELKAQQEAEAQKQKEAEEKLKNDLAEQEKLKQLQEQLKQEAEAKQKELEEQAKKLAEELEKKRQHEEWLKEQARLAELARQAEIARQQGKGGQEWYLAKPLPSFGETDPFETSLTGETVGNLVPDDYYRFTLSRNGRITAELKKLLADADLVLYDARNEPIAYSMREGITDEEIVADLIPGTYMLRVNSPKGVTTDYDLIVKFQHKLSMTQQGPPPGWEVGGNGGNGGVSGPTFSDPRIQQIYNTALNQFAGAERAKANTQVSQLEDQKKQLDQQLKDKLAKMNVEQRNKVYGAIDRVRDDQRRWVDDQAKPIKDKIDSSADWILNQIDNKIPQEVYKVWGIGDRLKSAKDDLKTKINEARSWLKGKIEGLQTQVKDAIWWFAEQLKNAYMTGAEINSNIEKLAQELKQKIDGYVSGINDLVGQFKGKITGFLQGLRNVGVDIPEIKDWWGHTITPGFKWNFYDGVIEPLANDLANSVKDQVNSAGNFAKGVVNTIKPLAQGAVAEIVSKFLGDETGHLYNQINGIDQQIANIRAGVERAINDAAKQILSVIRKIEALLTDPEERKRVLDALFRRGYQTAEEAYNFVKEELPKVRDQIVQEAKQAFEKAKKAFADLVRSKLDELLPGNNEKEITLTGGIGIEEDAIIEGGILKGSTEYKLSREFDENGKPFYFTSIKPSVGIEISAGVGSPIEAFVGADIQTGNIKASGQLINVKAEAGVSVQPNLGVEVKYKFDRNSDEDMARLGVFTFKELPTPFDSIDSILQSVILHNLYSVEPSLSGTFLAEAISPWAKSEISYTPSFKVKSEKNEFGGSNQIATVEAGLDVGTPLAVALQLNTKGKVSFSLESSQGTLQEISMIAEVPSFAASQLEFLAGKSLQSKVDEVNSTIASKGQAISTVKIETKIHNLSQLIDSGSKVVQDMVQLTQVNNLGEFTGDLVKTLTSIFSFFTNFRNSTEVETKAIAEQIISIEGEGKVFLGGEFNVSLGSTETFAL